MPMSAPYYYLAPTLILSSVLVDLFPHEEMCGWHRSSPCSLFHTGVSEKEDQVPRNTRRKGSTAKKQNSGLTQSSPHVMY